MDIRQIRKEAGLSQAELAAKARIDRSRLSLAENGHITLKGTEEAAIRAAVLAKIQELQAACVRALVGSSVSAA